MIDREEKVPLVFGEMLFDRFPDGAEVLGERCLELPVVG